MPLLRPISQGLIRIDSLNRYGPAYRSVVSVLPNRPFMMSPLCNLVVVKELDSCINRADAKCPPLAVDDDTVRGTSGSRKVLNKQRAAAAVVPSDNHVSSSVG